MSKSQMWKQASSISLIWIVFYLISTPGVHWFVRLFVCFLGTLITFALTFEDTPLWEPRRRAVVRVEVEDK
jgi:hypothetical protein